MKLGNRSKDLTNQVFGSLTAIKPTHIKNGMTYWEFLCICGKTIEARGNTIVHQSTKITEPQFPSCGCKELEQKTKHGYRKALDTHPAYRAYHGMMSRCYDTNNEGYQWYGAVGVTVCDEWKDNPLAFIEWSLANGWAKSLQIDKDVLCEAKGVFPHTYSPNTCQWTTAKVNVGFATNRSNFGKHPNVKLSHIEVSEIIQKYSDKQANGIQLAKEYGVTPNSIYRLIRIAQGKE